MVWRRAGSTLVRFLQQGFQAGGREGTWKFCTPIVPDWMSTRIASGVCKGHCQSKFYTACSRTRAGWSSTVFADESPTRSARIRRRKSPILICLDSALIRSEHHRLWGHHHLQRQRHIVHANGLGRQRRRRQRLLSGSVLSVLGGSAGRPQRSGWPRRAGYRRQRRCGDWLSVDPQWTVDRGLGQSAHRLACGAELGFIGRDEQKRVAILALRRAAAGQNVRRHIRRETLADATTGMRR